MWTHISLWTWGPQKSRPVASETRDFSRDLSLFSLNKNKALFRLNKALFSLNKARPREKSRVSDWIKLHCPSREGHMVLLTAAIWTALVRGFDMGKKNSFLDQKCTFTFRGTKSKKQLFVRDQKGNSLLKKSLMIQWCLQQTINDFINMWDPHHLWLKMHSFLLLALYWGGSCTNSLSLSHTHTHTHTYIYIYIYIYI